MCWTFWEFASVTSQLLGSLVGVAPTLHIGAFSEVFKAQTSIGLEYAVKVTSRVMRRGLGCWCAVRCQSCVDFFFRPENYPSDARQYTSQKMTWKSRDEYLKVQFWSGWLFGQIHRPGGKVTELRFT